jgi:hypothetical protein
MKYKFLSGTGSWNNYAVTYGEPYDYAGEGGVAEKTWAVGGWHDCRELLLRVWNINQKAVFYNAASKGQNVINFVVETERRLGIEDAKCTILPSPKGQIVQMEVSWWAETPIRRAFLTIILRAGIGYVDNFEDTLFSVEYTKVTKYATKRFMEGYTKTGVVSMAGDGFTGWVNEFRQKGWIYSDKNWFVRSWSKLWNKLFISNVNKVLVK